MVSPSGANHWRESINRQRQHLDLVLAVTSASVKANTKLDDVWKREDGGLETFYETFAGKKNFNRWKLLNVSVSYKILLNF